MRLKATQCPEIQLNEMDTRLAKAIARARRKNASEKMNIKSQKIDPNRDDMEIDIQGAGAEVAYAIFEGFYPNTNISGPDIGDYINRKGELVDVKQTENEDPHLLIRKDSIHKGKMADVYVLVQGKIPSFRMLGWISGTEFIRNASPWRGQNQSLCLHWSKLNQFKQ